MQDATITYYPVDNGDTSLLCLSDGTSILIDCNIREDSRDDNVEEVFDVHAHLLEILRQDEKSRTHLDAFILTHPDQDHCRGFADTFFIGDPSKFTAEDRKTGKIIIDELWFAPRIFSPHEDDLSEEADAVFNEAERRVDLYKRKDPSRNNPGNRIRIIGYSDNPDLKGLNDVITVPGGTIANINGKESQDFRFFVYAPIRKDTDASFSDRNDTSIVLRAQFDVDGEENACLAFFGGDAGCAIWERIADVNDAENLEFDLFLGPHHLSWYFFSETSQDDGGEPSEIILEFLRFKRKGAVVIASSKPIINDDDDPPSYAAAKLYKEIVGRENFLVTSEHPNTDRPEPIVFAMTKNGPVKEESPKVQKARTSKAINSAMGTPRTYG